MVLHNLNLVLNGIIFLIHAHKPDKLSSLSPKFIMYTVPISTAALCYANAVDGEFVHDDIFAIKENPDVIGISPITALLRNDFWGKDMCDNSSHKSYRPLTTLSFR